MLEPIPQDRAAVVQELRDVQRQLDRAELLRADASPRRDQLVGHLVNVWGYDHKTIAEAIGTQAIRIYNVVKRLERKNDTHRNSEAAQPSSV